MASLIGGRSAPCAFRLPPDLVANAAEKWMMWWQGAPCVQTPRALEAVTVAGLEAAANITIVNENGDQVSPTDLLQLAAKENKSDDE